MSPHDAGEPANSDGFTGPPQLSDPRVMRALSHPVRLALLELLTVEGEPLTATEAGERIGESPTTCSFHLRQLAKYGFVEEAGGGRGRARPWRNTKLGFSIDAETLSPAGEAAAETLLGIALKRNLERHAAARRARRSYPGQWRTVVSQNETVWWLTAEEAEEIKEEVTHMVQRHMQRTDPAQRPPGAKPVEFVTLMHPFGPPEDFEGSTDDEH
jgi:DNA-binding transcriptional ArsR family regulator